MYSGLFNNDETRSSPEDEILFLSSFSLLRNIESITIHSLVPTDVCQKLMDLMHGENEWEDVFRQLMDLFYAIEYDWE